MTDAGQDENISAHYSAARDDAKSLAEQLIAILEARGLARAALTAEHLHVVDQLHLRGAPAVVELLDALAIRPGDRVLDVGCGLGGPARMAAARYGAGVSGIDLTPSFCAAARELNALTGLEHIRIEQGDALAMPFPDDGFECAFSIHVAMNIADKRALYREIARVLKPGGRFALYDIVAGPGGPVHLPVPWASLPAHNHLLAAEEVGAAVQAAGFRTELFEDCSALAIEWLEARRAEGQARAEKGEAGPPDSAPLIMGKDFLRKQKHIYRNLKEDRIRVRSGIFHLME